MIIRSKTRDHVVEKEEMIRTIVVVVNIMIESGREEMISIVGGTIGVIEEMKEESKEVVEHMGEEMITIIEDIIRISKR